MKLEPVVLFIDEIEVLLGNRGGVGSFSEFKEIKVGEFLTAWDGFGNRGESVVVMGATNRKENLDEAILRRLPLQVKSGIKLYPRVIIDPIEHLFRLKFRSPIAPQEKKYSKQFLIMKK